MVDPRRPQKPRDDDAVPGIPALDGAEGEETLETKIDLDVHDDEASALDDHAAADLPGTLDTADDDAPSALDDAASDDAPVEADPALAAGETERWTEGSDASEDVPWQERDEDEREQNRVFDASRQREETSIDRGEEGFDDLAEAAGDALPGLPPARAGEADDGEADELDVSEAGTLETTDREPAEGPPLPLAAVRVAWHGPASTSVRAIAVRGSDVVAGGRGAWTVEGGDAAFPAIDEGSDVSALVVQGGALWIATEAGEVFRSAAGSAPTRETRPGTDDGSLGALDVVAIADVLVARTRGGALFRRSGDAWTGPIVAKNVRRVRAALAASPDWLALVVGSAAAPELLATRDARTFERIRGPEGHRALDAARSGDTVAVATTHGALLVTRDAGAHWETVPDVVDAERVWVTSGGAVLVATFHEATDHGRLVRVAFGGAEVVLDLAAEAEARRLSGPGEHDGDGRVHALATSPDGDVLWVATGIGVFEVRAT